MRNIYNYTPLRYPGGKALLTDFLSSLVDANGFDGGCIYCEPYAGGAGAAMALLVHDKVDRVILNDYDLCIYSLWTSILNNTNRFIDLTMTCPLDINEWTRQREIYKRRDPKDLFSLGFATFYLNRCNRSGIICNAGPIGGKSQSGTYKMDARFKRVDLAKRIERIAAMKDRIEYHNLDAIEFLKSKIPPGKGRNKYLVYLDPPYYLRGPELYLNFYHHDNHQELSCYLHRQIALKWIMSYDNAPEINLLYSGYTRIPLIIQYCAQRVRKENEILIVPRSVTVPDYLLTCTA